MTLDRDLGRTVDRDLDRNLGRDLDRDRNHDLDRDMSDLQGGLQRGATKLHLLVGLATRFLHGTA